MDQEDAVVLGRYLDVRSAEMVVSVLEGHEIESFINVPYTASMFPHLMLNRGGVAVFVRRADLEAARAVLDSADELPAEVDPDDA
jgi:hypothetical protein